MSPDESQRDSRASSQVDVQVDQVSTLPRDRHGVAVAPELDWDDRAPLPGFSDADRWTP